MTDLKIRRRERVDASPPQGLRQDWTEWQIVSGRKVVSRHGTQREAEKELARISESKA